MNDNTPVSSAASKRRRPRWRLALVALALCVAGAGAWTWWARRAEAQDPRHRYLLAKVEKGDIEDLVSATGSLQPRDYVDVGAQVSGQLRKIHVDVGSVVKEGDLLAEIDAEQSQARVEANRASLRAQQATLADREVSLVKAEREAKRQRQLMLDEATTSQALENAETDLRSARTGIAQVKAQIEQTSASMRVEEANLKYTRIYAPMDGTVVSIAARQGQTLNTNQQAPTLLRIANLETMTVQTQVSEADVAKLRGGMQAYFTTLGSQGRRWWGELRKVEPTPTVTNNVVLYNALFDVPNPNQQLMTQMTAQVYFVVAQAQDVLTVPMAALTVQRGTRNRGEARPEGAASATAPAAASAGSGVPALSPVAASAPREAGRRAGPPTAEAGDRPRRDAANGGEAREAGPRGPSGEGGERRWRGGENLSEAERAERAERWRNMSEAERTEAMERMRRQRAAAAEGGASAPAEPGRAPRAGAAGTERPRGERPARAGNAGGHAGGNNGGADGATRPVSSGMAGAANPARPRTAKVKVLAEDGTVQEREIRIGLSNRVSAQVLDGLLEGDQVVLGVKGEDPPKRAAAGNNNQQRNNNNLGLGQQGGMPGGPGFGGPPGGGR